MLDMDKFAWNMDRSQRAETRPGPDSYILASSRHSNPFKSGLEDTKRRAKQNIFNLNRS